MIIDKEKSKKMLKISSLVVAFGLVSIGNGIMLSPKLKNDLQKDYLENHFAMQRQQIKYFEILNKIDASSFDQNFMALYDGGKIKIFDKEYNIADLYIVMSKVNGLNYITSYKEANIDIFSGNQFESNQGRDLVLFKNSSAFYELYKLTEVSIYDGKLVMNLSNIDPLKIRNIVLNYNGEFHCKTPETLCYHNLKK